ncbi:MAG: hypothetical protein QOI23_2530 [Chloroflexota bacterium]|nr:hypothetical protein [Chloroflexota bacterium]
MAQAAWTVGAGDDGAGPALGDTPQAPMSTDATTTDSGPNHGLDRPASLIFR